MVRVRTIVWMALSLAACGAADTGALGARCGASAACASNRCVTSGSFPGGICTQACTDDTGCPSGWSCVSTSSGICLQNCASDADCVSYGASWRCGEESRERASGSRRVCTGR